MGLRTNRINRFAHDKSMCIYNKLVLAIRNAKTKNKDSEFYTSGYTGATIQCFHWHDWWQSKSKSTRALQFSVCVHNKPVLAAISTNKSVSVCTSRWQGNMYLDKYDRVCLCFYMCDKHKSVHASASSAQDNVWFRKNNISQCVHSKVQSVCAFKKKVSQCLQSWV